MMTEVKQAVSSCAGPPLGKGRHSDPMELPQKARRASQEATRGLTLKKHHKTRQEAP